MSITAALTSQLKALKLVRMLDVAERHLRGSIIGSHPTGRRMFGFLCSPTGSRPTRPLTDSPTKTITWQ